MDIVQVGREPSGAIPMQNGVPQGSVIKLSFPKADENNPHVFNDGPPYRCTADSYQPAFPFSTVEVYLDGLLHELSKFLISHI